MADEVGGNPQNVLVDPLEPGVIEVLGGHELEKTTMGELGDRLPNGSSGIGKELAGCAFHAPNLGTLRRVGELKARKDLTLPGKRAAYSLARVLTELEGVEFGKRKEELDALDVARLPVGDVLYLAFRWQFHKEPDGLQLTNQGCSTCGASYPEIEVDLSGLEVDTRPHGLEEPLRVRVGLRRGFDNVDGSRVSTVLLQSPTWLQTFWGLGQEGWGNPDLIRSWTFKAAICGTDAPHEGIRPTISMREVDQLYPVDARLIEEALATVIATPDLQVQLPACPKCGAKTLVGLDWTDPGFFGS